MRSFIAITIPDVVKTQLQAAVKRLTPHAVDVAWYSVTQFHLTITFLGETSPAILPHVSSALTRICATVQPFTCRAYGFGYFGTKRNPKVIWAGVDPMPELDMLHEAIGSELKRFGLKTEEDEFRPHITLGRCQERARNHPLVDVMNEDERIAFGSWPVSSLTLCESRVMPKGSIYPLINRFQFGG
ncbi:MAG: RNA 2',3'-cyclic phosphodiesterase [bacterium]|jgi:RNA 2',3'-cyclic 3'-phosphodiesterase